RRAFGHGHDAVGERAGARLPRSLPRRADDARQLSAHARHGGLSIRGAGTRVLRRGAAMARGARRRAPGVRLRQAAPQRRGVRARGLAGARTRHTSLSAEPRSVADAVPQHDVVFARDHHGARRPPAAGAARLPARGGGVNSRAQLATRAELELFLAAHPDVQAVQIMITDPSGVPRGKSVRREELQRIFESGRQVAGSILGLDITGEDVDATGLVWDTGDADMTARPIAGTLQVAPWLAATGQLMLTMFDGAGAPAAADPRHALVRAVDRFAALGMTPVVACELEFYLLRQEAGGQLVSAGGGRASERRKIDAYSLTRL